MVEHTANGNPKDMKVPVIIRLDQDPDGKSSVSCLENTGTRSDTGLESKGGAAGPGTDIPFSNRTGLSPFNGSQGVFLGHETL